MFPPVACMRGEKWEEGGMGRERAGSGRTRGRRSEVGREWDHLSLLIHTRSYMWSSPSTSESIVVIQSESSYRSSEAEHSSATWSDIPRDRKYHLIRINLDVGIIHVRCCCSAFEGVVSLSIIPILKVDFLYLPPTRKLRHAWGPKNRV